jgi:hypothetical protein
MPPLVLTPHGRSYRVTGGFNLALCLKEDPVAGAAPAESLIMQVGGTGCGTNHRPAVWVEIEAVIR